MNAQLCLADDDRSFVTVGGVQIASTEQKPSWSVGSRIAFRFCLVYFGLFCLLTQIFGSLVPIPLDFPDPSNFWPTRQIVTWTAVHVFGVTHPLVYMSGSGDKVFDWVLVFCLLIRRRSDHNRLVRTRPQTAELRRAEQMVSSGYSFCSGFADVGVRDDKSCSPANAVSASHQVTGAIRQLLAYGRSLVVRWCVSRL